MRTEFYQGEEYREIESHPLVFISAQGRMISFRKFGPNQRGVRSANPKEIHGSSDQDGYLFITKPKKFVHACLLLAWSGQRPIKHVARHLNGDRRDNRLANLKWGTHQENSQDMIVHGSIKGSKNPASKLTESDVIELRKAYIDKPLSALMLDYPQWSKFAIWAAVSGYTWTHLPGAIPGKRRCSKEGWKSGVRIRQ